MKVKEAETGGLNWVRGQIEAYLDGKKDLHWITSIIGYPTPAVRETFQYLNLMEYGDPNRRKELSDWFQQQ